MSERGIVDATRQGMPTTYKPDELPPVASAAPVSVDQALAAVEGWRSSGMPLFGLHQVAIALRQEVERLNAEVFAREELLRIAQDDADRVRCALPGIIGCAHGEAETCTRDPCGYGMCCATRNRMVRAGLLPRPPRREEPEDGA